MDAVYSRNSDIEAGTIAAFEAGALDIPFALRCITMEKSCRCVITMAIRVFNKGNRSA